MYKFYYNTSHCHANNIFHETFSHTNSIYLFGREKHKTIGRIDTVFGLRLKLTASKLKYF